MKFLSYGRCENIKGFDYLRKFLFIYIVLYYNIWLFKMVFLVQKKKLLLNVMYIDRKQCVLLLCKILYLICLLFFYFILGLKVFKLKLSLSSFHSLFLAQVLKVKILTYLLSLHHHYLTIHLCIWMMQNLVILHFVTLSTIMACSHSILKTWTCLKLQSPICLPKMEHCFQIHCPW